MKSLSCNGTSGQLINRKKGPGKEVVDEAEPLESSEAQGMLGIRPHTVRLLQPPPSLSSRQQRLPQGPSAPKLPDLPSLRVCSPVCTHPSPPLSPCLSLCALLFVSPSPLCTPHLE